MTYKFLTEYQRTQLEQEKLAKYIAGSFGLLLAALLFFGGIYLYMLQTGGAN